MTRDLLPRLLVVLGVSLLVNVALLWNTRRVSRQMVITRCAACGLEAPPTPAPLPKTPPPRESVEEARARWEAVEKKADAIDLLKLIDPPQDSVHGFWVMERYELIGLRARTADQPGRLQIPYVPPPEYDVVFELVRKSGSDGILLGLASEYGNFNVVLDRYPAEGFKSGLELIDGQSIRNNPTTRTGILLPIDTLVTVHCSVRKGGVTVSVDNHRIVDWREDSPRLSQNPVSRAREPRALSVGCWDSRIQFKKIILAPAGGSGKRLR